MTTEELSIKKQIRQIINTYYGTDAEIVIDLLLQLFHDETDDLREKLKVSMEALDIYASSDSWGYSYDSDNIDLFLETPDGFETAREALKKIGRVE